MRRPSPNAAPGHAPFRPSVNTHETTLSECQSYLFKDINKCWSGPRAVPAAGVDAAGGGGAVQERRAQERLQQRARQRARAGAHRAARRQLTAALGHVRVTEDVHVLPAGRLLEPRTF